MIRKHLCLAACALCLYACGGNSGRTAQEARENTPAANAADDGHNAENALDYTGTYEGTIPAADCPGINVNVELHADNTFECRYDYMERDASFEFKGSYRIEQGRKITDLRDLRPYIEQSLASARQLRREARAIEQAQAHQLDELRQSLTDGVDDPELRRVIEEVCSQP